MDRRGQMKECLGVLGRNMTFVDTDSNLSSQLSESQLLVYAPQTLNLLPSARHELLLLRLDYEGPEAGGGPKARVLVALGQIAHGAAVRTCGGKLSAYKFGHLAEHQLPDGRILIDSYHCSRYNQNTGRLTAPMFEAVFERAIALRDGT